MLEEVGNTNKTWVMGAVSVNTNIRSYETPDY